MEHRAETDRDLLHGVVDGGGALRVVVHEGNGGDRFGVRVGSCTALPSAIQATARNCKMASSPLTNLLKEKACLGNGKSGVRAMES